MSKVKLNKVQRTIASETMDSVMKYTPKDSFKLSDTMLNKVYTVTSIDEFEIGTVKSFSVSMEDESGSMITLSASALKRSRMLPSTGLDIKNPYKGTKHIYKRSDGEEIWSQSQYLHRSLGMAKNEDFTIPEKLKLRYALISEDQSTGEPLINPYLYREYRKLVKEYSKRDEYPTMDDFREELLTSIEDGRLPFLPLNLLKPTPYAWVKNEIGDFRHTLVFESLT